LIFLFDTSLFLTMQPIFALAELKEAGFVASEVVRVFLPVELVRVGFTKDELKVLCVGVCSFVN
jgi:hypothetical protein